MLVNSNKKSIDQILLDSHVSKLEAKVKENPGLGKNIGDFLANAGAYGTSEFIKGLGNLAKMSDYINPVSYLAKAMGKEEDTFGAQTHKGAEVLAKQPIELQEKLGTTESTGGNAGAVTGKVLGTVAAQVPALVAGGEAVSALKGAGAIGSVTPTVTAGEKIPTAAKIVSGLGKAEEFALKSAGTTALVTGTTEGELPSAKELVGYGALDLALMGTSKLGSALYKSAFKGSKTVEKNLVSNYEKTVADIAEELGYAGGEKAIIDQARTAKNTVWGQIKELAQTNKPVTREQFINTVYPKLAEKLRGLPDNTVKDKLLQTIKTTVEDYAPKTTATGSELIEQITDLNKGLFGEGAKTVLSPKQMSSLESGLKAGMKDLLPEEVKPLYQEYANNKLIEQIMQDERVKRYVARALVGGGTGAVVGAVSGGENPTSIVKNAIIGAIVGSLTTSVTGKGTATSTVGGKTLTKAARPEISVLVKDIVNRIVGDQE